MNRLLFHGQILSRPFVQPAVLAAFGVIAILVAFFVWPPDQVRADATVTTCTRDGVQAALAVGGLVTFSCGSNPPPIDITSTLIVTRSVTLNGANLITLDGGDNWQIISLTTGSALTLTNITLQRGLAQAGVSGGAVYVPGSAALTTLSATFASNRADFGPIEHGGAIYGEDGSRIVIRSTTFVSNTAKDNGGGLFAISPVTITDSTFLGNSAKFGGGIWAARAMISDSRILSNSVDNEGGGIYAVTATITGSIIAGNRAPTGNGGGAYVSTSATITGSEIVSNTANNGAGIWAASATLSGTRILSNTTNLGSGGGIFAGLATIVGSTIENNVVVLDGGGVSASTAVIVNSMIARNRATVSGGGVAGTQVTITGTRIMSNAAQFGGGLLSFDAASITSSTFVSNTARDYGGAIVANSAVLEGSTIQANSAITSGGGVSVTMASIANSFVLSNSALGGIGGGIAAVAVVTISGSTVRGNSAQTGGGVASLFAAVITGTSIVSNSASAQVGGGGANTWLRIVNSTVMSNTAGQVAGVYAEDLTVDASTLAGNRATTSVGGAMLAVSANLANSTVVGNSAATGGGAVFFGNRLVMTNSTVVNNGTKAISGTTTSVPFTLTNSIVSGPASPICSHGGFMAGSVNLPAIFDTCYGSGSVVPGDPLLGPLQDNGGPTWTMALLPGSPAINQGAPCQVAVDQRGFARTAPCDLGAYETGIQPTLISLAPTGTIAVGPDFTLTVTGTGFIPGTVALWNGAPRPTGVVNSTVLTVSIPAADIIATGVVSIQARYGLAADSLSNALSFTITRRSQTITFGPLANKTFGDAPFGLGATASSGLAVAYSASGACSVAGATVTLTAVGSCTITASQAGDLSYLAAQPIAQTFMIGAPPASGRSVTLPAVVKNRAPS